MTRLPRITPAICRAALVAPVLALSATACGIGVDEAPRPLDVEASTTTVPASLSEGQLSTMLYYVRDGKLLPIDRELPDRTPSTIVNALTQSPTPAIPGVGTSLPAGTRVLDVTRDGDRLVVNLSRDFDTVVGLARQQAIGQMVMSITRGPVDEVEFHIDGRPLTVASPSQGDTTFVDQCDFAELLAARGGTATEGVPTASIRELERRQAELDSKCTTR